MPLSFKAEAWICFGFNKSERNDSLDAKQKIYEMWKKQVEYSGKSIKLFEQTNQPGAALLKINVTTFFSTCVRTHAHRYTHLYLNHAPKAIKFYASKSMTIVNGNTHLI